MSRSVPEWIGRSDDSAIPDRVMDRVAEKAERCCQKCGLETVGKLRGQADHIIPLVLGGGHRESNLQWLCEPCHRAKTKLDVKLKAKVSRVRKRHLGIRKPSRFPCSRNSRWKKKVGGEVVQR
jgi:5-methylcytosine-specific restriction endonuclease McrA